MAAIAVFVISTIALPVVAEISQLSVRRDLHSMAAIAVFVITRIALPVVAKIVQTGILWKAIVGWTRRFLTRWGMYGRGRYGRHNRDRRC